jgi:hypothetical protein
MVRDFAVRGQRNAGKLQHKLCSTLMGKTRRTRPGEMRRVQQKNCLPFFAIATALLDGFGR